MNAGTKSINDILNGNRILEIPFFQRAYVWSEDQWERLLEDMEQISQNGRPYFLGSIILKQQQTSTVSNTGDVRTVIDGQQRLTTLSIFFKVLCLKTNQLDRFNRIFRLFNNSLAIQHNHNDIAFFETVMSLETLDTLDNSNRIFSAYEYFQRTINTDNLNFDTIINNIVFVGIDLHYNEDEQQIFDTINSLGVGLTTAELLKNYFFNRDIEAYETYWKTIFEPLNDEETRKYWDRKITIGRSQRTFIDLFFYSYLQIKIQEPGINVSSLHKNEFSKVESLFESYKKFIDRYNLNKQSILNEIRDYAVIFKGNFEPEVVNRELTNDYGIERINAIIFGLDTSPLISYVLFILKNVQDENQRNGLFELIESYIMRRIITRATGKNYNQLFADRLIANRVLSAGQFKEYIQKQDDKVNYMPDDLEIKNGFNSSQLVNKQALGIIYMIESKIRNRGRQGTQILGMSKYSLEHLMPKKWENNWGQLSDQEEKMKRNRKLLTLGNLAIITQSLNASIRDADWNTKKIGRQGKEGLITYSGGIETLSAYLQLPDWNEKEIEKRANSLCEFALSTWKGAEAFVDSNLN